MEGRLDAHLAGGDGWIFGWLGDEKGGSMNTWLVGLLDSWLSCSDNCQKCRGLGCTGPFPCIPLQQVHFPNFSIHNSPISVFICPSFSIILTSLIILTFLINRPWHLLHICLLTHVNVNSDILILESRSLTSHIAPGPPHLQYTSTTRAPPPFNPVISDHSIILNHIIWYHTTSYDMVSIPDHKTLLSIFPNGPLGLGAS